MPVSWRTSGDKEKARSHTSEAQRLLAVNRQMLTASPAHTNFKSFERLEDGTEVLIRSFRASAVGASFAPEVTSIVEIKAPVVGVVSEEEIGKRKPEKNVGLYVGGVTSPPADSWGMEGYINDKQKWKFTGVVGDNIGFLSYWGSRADEWPLYDVAVDETGVYYVGGRLLPDYSTNWRVEKRNLKDGSLIWEAEGNADGEYHYDSIAVGVKVVGENVYIGVYAGYQPAAAKLNKADGSLLWQQQYNLGFIDEHWDGHGLVILYPSDIGVSPNEDFMWVGGEVESYNTGLLQNSWVVLKIDCLNGGSLGYIEEIIVNNGRHNVNAIEADSEGMYEGGNVYQYSPDGFGWRIVKRNHSGGIIWDRQFPPISTSYYSGLVYDVALDDKYVYVVGDESELPTIRCFSKEDGSTIWEVKGETNQQWALGVTISGDFIYTCGWYAGIEKRNKKDGSLVKIIKEQTASPYTGDFYRCAAIEL